MQTSPGQEETARRGGAAKLRPGPWWLALAGIIYGSYQQFRTSVMDWSDISGRAYLNSRGLA
jgi:hypothetical protein